MSPSPVLSQCATSDFHIFLEPNPPPCVLVGMKARRLRHRPLRRIRPFDTMSRRKGLHIWKGDMSVFLDRIETRLKKAVSHYWTTRRQQGVGRKAKDTGARSMVTGGKQMNGFATLVADVLCENGMCKTDIHLDSKLQLPGFFRPTKKWDLVVVHRGHLNQGGIHAVQPAGWAARRPLRTG